MLTQESKQILDYALPIFESGTDTLSIAQIQKEVGLSLLEVNSTIEYLVEQGYFKIKRYMEGSFIYSPSHKALHYNDFDSITSPPTSQTNIFNGPVTSSAIGNTGNITIANGISFEDAISFIHAQDIPFEDKAEAEKMVTYIETLTENDAPLKKGFLSKFNDILAKHPCIPELAMKLLFQYLTGQQL